MSPNPKNPLLYKIHLIFDVWYDSSFFLSCYYSDTVKAQIDIYRSCELSETSADLGYIVCSPRIGNC